MGRDAELREFVAARGPALSRPRHTAQVSAFRIERTEVTVSDYRKYVAETRANPSTANGDDTGVSVMM